MEDKNYLVLYKKDGVKFYFGIYGDKPMLVATDNNSKVIGDLILTEERIRQIKFYLDKIKKEIPSLDYTKTHKKIQDWKEKTGYGGPYYFPKKEKLLTDENVS